MFKADYHLHSQLSFDASASLTEIAQAASDKGINEICVTDHYECARPKMIARNTPVDVMRREYLNSVAKNKADVSIKFGIELGQPSHNSYKAEMALTDGGFDYVLASVHGVGDDIVMHHVDYTDASCYDAIEKYYDETIKVIEWGKFDVLAHFNLFLRNAARQDVTLDLGRFDKKIDEIIKALAQSGKGLEINAASIYQALGYALPGTEILKKFREYGGSIITVGSDSHEMANIGRGLDAAYDMARAAGFTKCARFSRRNVSFYDIV